MKKLAVTYIKHEINILDTEVKGEEMKLEDLERIERTYVIDMDALRNKISRRCIREVEKTCGN